MFIKEKLTTIANIGKKRAALFEKLQIYCVGDLLRWYPREYEDLSRIYTIEGAIERAIYLNEAGLAEKISLTGHLTRPKTFYQKGLAITRATLTDNTGEIDITWFSQPYIQSHIDERQAYYLIGVIGFYNGRAQLNSPVFEKYTETPQLAGRIIPIYPLTAGISQNLMQQTVRGGLKQYLEHIEDYLPEEILLAGDLLPLPQAIENIHFPANMEIKDKARKRLAFDELFMLQLGLLELKEQSLLISKKPVSPVDLELLFEAFPFSFTQAQKRVVDEIERDLLQGQLMNRLIQGDVGSGKTAVSMVAAYIVIKNNQQVAFMAPTEVLAKQHYESISRVFKGLSIETVLLTGGLREKEKTLIEEKIKTGKAQMIIGTHALIQDSIEFFKLGLIMADEQHRFGVRQRRLLSEKGDNPHVLLFSATPIPRTLGLIIYSDLDISLIDELPPGRQKIMTYGVNSAFRERLRLFIEKEVRMGRQAYIICPLIEPGDTEGKGLISVLEMEAFYKEHSQVSVDIVYGSLSSLEKEKAMNDFSGGKTDLLIATTVVEVGVDVPNATIMIVENAERFGLSQLHQLRGRVGRGKSQSYCILVTDSKSATALERVEVMMEMDNGFDIAERDLLLRGTGNFFGTEQHGLPPLTIANLYEDIDILQASKKIASQYQRGDYGIIESLEREIANYLKKFDVLGL